MAEFNTRTIHSAPPPFQKCDAQKCPWWPYTNSKDFKANSALIIVILFCSLICLMALNTLIRYIIRIHCTRIQDEENPKPSVEKKVEIPSVIYSEGMKLAGADQQECIICLSEFVIGEKIGVLEKCSHGFHVQCIQKWLVSHSTCPMCRVNCTVSHTNQQRA